VEHDGCLESLAVAVAAGSANDSPDVSRCTNATLITCTAIEPAWKRSWPDFSRCSARSLGSCVYLALELVDGVVEIQDLLGQVRVQLVQGAVGVAEDAEHALGRCWSGAAGPSRPLGRRSAGDGR
jgi:hypothetical protein